MTVDEIKSKITSLENGVKNPNISDTIKEGMKKGIIKLQAELAKLETEAANAVTVAEKKEGVAEEKIEKAEKKGDAAAVKKGKKELKEAKGEKKEAAEEVKEVKKTKVKAKKAEKKAVIEVKKAKEKKASVKESRKAKVASLKKKKATAKKAAAKGQHGGKRHGAGRKASSHLKVIKPKGIDNSKLAVRKSTAAAIAAAAKVKSVRAFGQKVEYKNDADFCKQLISAFKKRRAVSKQASKRRKTKPVFGVIVTSTKNAVSKALHSVSDKKIESNPKKFLADAQRLEKSAVRFLEDFKTILGTDYKSSEIKSEFGELEKSIKAFVAKVTKE